MDKILELRDVFDGLSANTFYLIPIIFVVVGCIVSVFLFNSRKPDTKAPKFRKIIETASSPSKKKKRNTVQATNETSNGNAFVKKNKKEVSPKTLIANEKKSNDLKKVINNSPKQKENSSNNTNATAIAKATKNKSVKNIKNQKEEPLHQLNDDEGEWQTVTMKKQKKQIDLSPTNGAKNSTLNITKVKTTKPSVAVESKKHLSTNEASISTVPVASAVQAIDIVSNIDIATKDSSPAPPIENNAAFDELGDILLKDANSQKRNKKRARKE